LLHIETPLSQRNRCIQLILTIVSHREILQKWESTSSNCLFASVACRLPLAIVLHSLVDFSTFGLEQLTNNQGVATIVLAAWAIGALILLRWVRRREPASAQAAVPRTMAGVN
jgi:hypothetical protein